MRFARSLPLFLVICVFLVTDGYAQILVGRTFLKDAMDKQDSKDHKGAVASFTSALAEFKKLGFEKEQMITTLLRGFSHLKLEQYQEAEVDLEGALEAAKKIYPKNDDPIIVEAAENLATVYFRQSRYEECAKYRNWVLLILEYQKKPAADIAKAQYNYALALDLSKKLPDAVTLYQKVITYLDANPGDKVLDAERVKEFLGEALYELNRKDDFEALHKRLVEESKKINSREVPTVVKLLRTVAKQDAKRGDFKMQIAHLQESLGYLSSVSTKILKEKSAIYNELGDAFLSADQLNDAVDVFEKELQLIRDEYGDESKEAADASYSLAWALYRSEKYDEAHKASENALKTYRERLGKEDVKVAHTLRVQGHIGKATDNLDEAVSSYEEALGIYQGAGQESNDNAVATMKDLANLYSLQKRNGKAREMLEQAVEKRESQFGAKSIEAAKSLSDLAWFHRLQGDLVTAERLYEESLERAEEIAKKNPPEISSILTGLAAVYREQGKKDKARESLNRNLNALEAQGNSSQIGNGLLELADLLEEMGEYQEAESLSRRAVSVYESVRPANQIQVAKAKKQLAWNLIRLDRYIEGKVQVLAAIEILEKAGTEGEDALSGAYNTYASALRRSGQYSESLKYFSESLKISERESKESAYYAIYNIGTVLSSLGEYEAAEQNYREAISRHSQYKAKNPPKTDLQRLHLLVSDSRQLHALSGLLVKREQYDEAEKLIRQAMKTLEEGVENHVDLAGMVRTLAGILEHKNRYSELESLASKQLEIVESSSPKLHTDYVDAISYIASTNQMFGRDADAEKLLEEAYELSQTLFGRKHRDTLAALSELFDAYISLGKVADARILAGVADDISKQLESDDLKHLTILGIHARIMEVDGNFLDAVASREQQLEWYTRNPKNFSSSIFASKLGLSQLMASYGDSSTAEDMLKEAGKPTDNWGENDLNKAWYAAIEAEIAAEKDEDRIAIDKLQEVVELRKRHPDVWGNSLVLAELKLVSELIGNGQVDKAIDTWEKVKDGTGKRFTQTLPVRVQWLYTESKILCEQSVLEQALEKINKAIELCGKNYSKSSAVFNRLSLHKCKVLMKLNKEAEAVELIEQVVQNYDKSLFKFSKGRLESLEIYSQLLKQSDPEKAKLIDEKIQEVSTHRSKASN